MNKIINSIWWIATIMLVPLDASCVVYYIVEENFNFSFWVVAIAFVLLSCVLGIRLCIMENRKDK